MISLYDGHEYEHAKKARGKLLTLYICIAIAAIGINLLVFFLLKPVSYGWGLFANCVLTVGFGAWSLFFFAIKFRLTLKYCKMLKYLRVGLQETDRGVFLKFDDGDMDKEGVTFYGAVVEERVKKRPDMPERRILIDREIPRPDFIEGDLIRYTTQGNILVEYRILKRRNDAGELVEYNADAETTQNTVV